MGRSGGESVALARETKFIKQDRKTQRVQRDILDNEKPNYVQVQVQHDGQISGLTFSVFNGDLVTGNLSEVRFKAALIR